ncbi:hypothetical protein NC653_007996 [Populus alba x Populus x berolinensis]|uniref:Uncharacterized protein n=1 Tax=Populus alba x Populus x berolinensis TaxID=444605 RepID=A0AAD6R5Q1_9ROSI|nr:hypothetical protein NC653_007996 [Populus alba x Populus x berolinensis]
MDSNETEVCPIKKALEISVPSSLASQLNWAVESDSVSSQAMDDAASLNLILFPLMATLRTVTEFARQKNKFPISIIPMDCYSVGDITIHRRLLSVGNLVGELLKYRQNIPSVNSSVLYLTDGINPLVNLLVSHENTDRIYSSGNLLVMVAATV